MSVPVPTGTLSDRLLQLADIHERNGLMCSPAVTSNRAVLETLNRHALIHEQAAADIREAVGRLEERALTEATAPIGPTPPQHAAEALKP